MAGNRYWKGRLDEDGLIADLYSYIWSVGDDLKQLSIPDTVLFEQGFPKVWYSWEGKPGSHSPYGRELKKHLGKDITDEKIVRKFEKLSGGGDIIAEYSTYRMNPETLRFELRYDYFNADGLRRFLTSRAAGASGVLQRFLYPKTVENAVLQGVWSTNATFISIRKNKNPLNSTIDLRQRCVTYDGPPQFSSWGIVTPFTQKRVEAAMLELVMMFKRTENIPLVGLVAMFKVDSMGNLYMLNCTSLRTKQTNITGSRNPISMNLNFSETTDLGADHMALMLPSSEGQNVGMDGNDHHQGINEPHSIRNTFSSSAATLKLSLQRGSPINPATTGKRKSDESQHDATMNSEALGQTVVTLNGTANQPSLNTTVLGLNLSTTSRSAGNPQSDELLAAEAKTMQKIQRAYRSGVLTLDINAVSQQELAFVDAMLVHGSNTADTLNLLHDTSAKFELLAPVSASSPHIVGWRKDGGATASTTVGEDDHQVQSSPGASSPKKLQPRRPPSAKSSSANSTLRQSTGVLGAGKRQISRRQSMSSNSSTATATGGLQRLSSFNLQEHGGTTSSQHTAVLSEAVQPRLLVSPMPFDKLPTTDMQVEARQILFNFLRDAVYHSLAFHSDIVTGAKAPDGVSGVIGGSTPEVHGSRLLVYKFMLPVELRPVMHSDRVIHLCSLLGLGREFAYDEATGLRVDILYFRGCRPYSEEELFDVVMELFPKRQAGASPTVALAAAKLKRKSHSKGADEREEGSGSERSPEEDEDDEEDGDDDSSDTSCGSSSASRSSTASEQGSDLSSSKKKKKPRRRQAKKKRRGSVSSGDTAKKRSFSKDSSVRRHSVATTQTGSDSTVGPHLHNHDILGADNDESSEEDDKKTPQYSISVSPASAHMSSPSSKRIAAVTASKSDMEDYEDSSEGDNEQDVLLAQAASVAMLGGDNHNDTPDQQDDVVVGEDGELIFAASTKAAAGSVRSNPVTTLASIRKDKRAQKTGRRSVSPAKHPDGRVLVSATPAGHDQLVLHGQHDQQHHRQPHRPVRVERLRLSEYKPDWRMETAFPKMPDLPATDSRKKFGQRGAPPKTWAEREATCELSCFRRLIVHGGRSYIHNHRTGDDDQEEGIGENSAFPFTSSSTPRGLSSSSKSNQQRANTTKKHDPLSSRYSSTHEETPWEKEQRERLSRHNVQRNLKAAAVKNKLDRMPPSMQYWTQL